jgi:hypothetical protein
MSLPKYVENERLQVRNGFPDRHLDIEDITIALYNAVDITKSAVSHGREEAFTMMSLEEKRVVRIGT